MLSFVNIVKWTLILIWIIFHKVCNEIYVAYVLQCLRSEAVLWTPVIM